METLYRLYDADDNLLYIGATSQLFTRINQHRLSKGWWDECATARFERFVTLDELLVAEVDAIRAEKPQHNPYGADWFDRKDEREREFVQFVRETVERTGRGPTYPGIATRFNLDRGSVYKWLCQLRRDGLITWDSGSSATMRALDHERQGC